MRRCCFLLMVAKVLLLLLLIVVLLKTEVAKLLGDGMFRAKGLDVRFPTPSSRHRKAVVLVPNALYRILEKARQKEYSVARLLPPPAKSPSLPSQTRRHCSPQPCTAGMPSRGGTARLRSVAGFSPTDPTHQYSVARLRFQPSDRDQSS